MARTKILPGNTTWSSKSNGKDKILPGLARAMERKKIPGLARAMTRTKYYLDSSKSNSKSNGKDKILPGLARAMERTKAMV